MRRLTNATTYRVITRGHLYAVTMERINNAKSGCPRWDVTITDLDALNSRSGAGAYRYRFSGHHMSEADEAREAVRQHEELIERE